MTFSIEYDKQPLKFLKNQDNKTTLKRLKDVRNSLLAHRAKVIKNRRLSAPLIKGDKQINFRIQSNALLNNNGL